MNTVVIVLIGMVLGWSIQPKLHALFAWEYQSQMKAIRKKFSCKKNEFSYYLEDGDGYYIVSFNDREFRIKFSVSKPTQIVYCQEVERING